MSVGCKRQYVPLESLGAGQHGRVIEIEGHHPLVNRLAEMGIQPGARLQMLRPGQPCIIAIGNQRMIYRVEKDEALVLVELV